MNNHPIVSGIAASDLSGKEHKLVKLTSGGIDIANQGDKVIGTLLRGAAAGYAVDVSLAFGHALHYVVCGDTTAITIGDDLAAGSVAGTVIKKATGYPTIAQAWESVASAVGAQFRALIQKGNSVAPAWEVIAAGVHPWAGGAATTDSIAITGLLTSDVVICSLTAQGASELLAHAVSAAGQINVTLSANGTNTTTKVSYLALRQI